MTIQIDPHFRVRVLPNVGFRRKDDALEVYAELENIRKEVIGSANLAAVAYDSDGTLCGFEESFSGLVLHEGERKAVKLVMELTPDQVEVLRLYVQTEYDEDDPHADAIEDPPDFMQRYLRSRTETPPSEG